MAEGARLESVYTARYRGFESLPHRHYILNTFSRRFSTTSRSPSHAGSVAISTYLARCRFPLNQPKISLFSLLSAFFLCNCVLQDILRALRYVIKTLIYQWYNRVSLIISFLMTFARQSVFIALTGVFLHY